MPHQRKEMLETGAFVGVLSVLTGYYWMTKDWWLPETVLGTRVGIEDFIMGFLAGGIMASLYERCIKPDEISIYHKHSKLHSYIVATIFLITSSFLIFVLGVGSASAVFISLCFCIIYIVYVRRDLVRPMCTGGILSTGVFSLPYIVAIMFFPGWIDSTYLFQLGGLTVYGIPVEEFIFGFSLAHW